MTTNTFFESTVYQQSNEIIITLIETYLILRIFISKQGQIWPSWLYLFTNCQGLIGTGYTTPGEYLYRYGYPKSMEATTFMFNNMAFEVWCNK